MTTKEILKKETENRKRIEVVAAIILNENQIFATQRGYGAFKGFWEFPGGKIEQGETKEEALIREIREELSIEIEIGAAFRTIEWDYPDFHLTMHSYWCRQISKSLRLNEHEDARWLSKKDLFSVRWLPADIQLLKEIEKILT